ncbi:CD3324 family protein [Clostridium sp. Marseille-Q7071]
MVQYINAKDVLPETLILQIQQYVGGSIIYIPKKDNDKKSWATSTNSRNEIIERNNEIKKKKKNGATIDELMAEYHLSYDTIKSIIYRKK